MKIPKESTRKYTLDNNDIATCTCPSIWLSSINLDVINFWNIKILIENLVSTMKVAINTVDSDE